MANDQDPEKSLEDAIEASLSGTGFEELEAALAAGDDKLHAGIVAGVTGKDVFVELGPRAQGVISVDEFADPPSVGDSIQVRVLGRDQDLFLLGRRAARVVSADHDLEPGDIVTAQVVGENKGGLELKVGDTHAFMPFSQVDLGRVEDVSDYVGTTVSCEVVEVDRSQGRLVVSRRAVLGRQKEEGARQVASNISVGGVLKGRVTKIEPFGAFVEIADGVEGLLHVSNISRKRVEAVEEVLSVGQQVEAVVLEVTDAGSRISLGMKQLEPNPWDDLAARFSEDDVVTGSVTRIAKFGAFVQVAEGVEGLLHVSQIAPDRVRRIRDHLREGDEISVRIVAVEADRERLSLSRLTPGGQIIGGDEEADENLLDEIVNRPGRPAGGGGTNLGDLLRKALKD